MKIIYLDKSPVCQKDLLTGQKVGSLDAKKIVITALGQHALTALSGQTNHFQTDASQNILSYHITHRDKMTQWKWQWFFLVLQISFSTENDFDEVEQDTYSWKLCWNFMMLSSWDGHSEVRRDSWLFWKEKILLSTCYVIDRNIITNECIMCSSVQM